MSLEEDDELLRRRSRELGIKPWDYAAPWEPLEGECPHPGDLARAGWEAARRLRARMLKTARGRAILAECEAAYDRLVDDLLRSRHD